MPVIEKDVVNHFKALYSKSSSIHARFSNWEGKALSQERLLWLERPFSIEKIQAVVFPLAGNKPPPT